MALVRYPKFRQHEAQRVQTNNTMMGLLAGSRLAAQTLRLTAGSPVVLSQLFPEVPHIERFNLKVDGAREILEDAENLLGVLAIPQVIALHEDLLRGALEMLADSDSQWSGLLDNAKAANVHKRVALATNFGFNAHSEALFHLVRVARNAHIHSGGRADRTLTNRINDTAASMPVWQDITGEAFPAYSEGDFVRLALPELIGILAITKRLAEETNQALQSALARDYWADIVVSDWDAQPRGGNPEQLLRSLTGVARHYYGPLRLTRVELESALARKPRT